MAPRDEPLPIYYLTHTVFSFTQPSRRRMDCTPFAARWAFRCVRNRRLLAITCAESLLSCVPVTSLSRTLKACRGVHLHGVEHTAIAVQCQDRMLHMSGTIIQDCLYGPR
jgi:hypothetical protein